MKSAKLGLRKQLNTNLKKSSFKHYCTFLEHVLRSSGHPDSDKLARLLRAKKFTELVYLADSLASTEYQKAGEHRLLNQLAALIRKYPWPEGTVEFTPEALATSIFLKSERFCKLTNRKFRLFETLRSPNNLELSIARNWISYVLGELDYSRIWELCSYGPGASVGVHGNATNLARKLLCKRWSVSPGAYYYAEAALAGDIHVMEYLNRTPGHNCFCVDRSLFSQRFRSRSHVIQHNKITFVPKTAKVLRTIAVEPLLNGYIQKGVDEFMRSKLKRVGIDLRDQTRNQNLAKLGSLGGDDPYVTVDLSSASDSISIGLCKHLLPPEWFEFLNAIRSHNYELHGKVYPYHKFTTMGNGFCFPLETLIFASLCVASGCSSPSDFSVYGDDIIVRSSTVPKLFDLLKVCGFKVNRDKTFISGPFRESCGADWFEGMDVRPITLDFAFDSIESIFKFINLSRSKGVWQDILSEGCDYLQSLIPKELLLVRPYSGQIDTALEVPLDVFMNSPFSLWDSHLQSWSWLEFVKSGVPDTAVRHFEGYDLAVMKGAMTGSTSQNPFTERRNTRTKIRRNAYSGTTSTALF